MANAAVIPAAAVTACDGAASPGLDPVLPADVRRRCCAAL